MIGAFHFEMQLLQVLFQTNRYLLNDFNNHGPVSFWQCLQNLGYAFGLVTGAVTYNTSIYLPFGHKKCPTIPC